MSLCSATRYACKPASATRRHHGYSVYLLYWYKSTHTDATAESGGAAKRSGANRVAFTTSQFTCFTGTKVHLLTGTAGAAAPGGVAGAPAAVGPVCAAASSSAASCTSNAAAATSNAAAATSQRAVPSVLAAAVDDEAVLPDILSYLL